MKTFLKKILFLVLEIAPIVILGLLFGFIGMIIGLVVSLLVLGKYVIHYEGELILYLYKAHPALELPQVLRIAGLLSNRKGVSMPSLFITNMPLPGSFIIGKSPKNTKVVIPAHVINFLKEEELEAMIAYNIAQIDADIHKRTRAALIASLLTMAASYAKSGAVLVGFGDFDDPMPKFIGKFVKGLVAPPAATLIQLIAKKDYDLEASGLYKNPDIMISTIERLGDNNVMANPSIGFLCIIDPRKEDFFDELYVTHPPKRIQNLNDIIRRKK